MTRWHLRPHRKSTGGLLNSYRKKKRYERGSKFLESKLGEHRNKIVTCTGGNRKTKLLSADKVNVAKKGKARQVKIESVLENPTNPNYVRRNVLTRGAVVKTELGNVRITSRPGQDGIVNGIVVSGEKK